MAGGAVKPFSRGICTKVKVIARLDSEQAYYDSAVYRLNYYTTRTPPIGAVVLYVVFNDIHLNVANIDLPDSL